MKKKAIIITVALLVAVAGAAEYKIFIAGHSKPDTLQISVQEDNAKEGISQRENAIVVSQSGELKYFYEGLSISEKDEQKVAAELLKVIDKIEKMSKGTVTKNTDIVKKPGENEYYKVNDKTFGNISDLKAYISTYVTSSLINERYSGMIEGDVPVYLDFEDGLYVKRRNDHAEGFEWERDSNKNIILAITGKGDGKFTVTSSGHTIGIAEENGKWKINSID